MAIVNFCLSSFLLLYGGRQIWLKHVCDTGSLQRKRPKMKLLIKHSETSFWGIICCVGYQSVETSILEILKFRSTIPPTGTRSLPVVKWSSFFCSSREKPKTTSQKALQPQTKQSTDTLTHCIYSQRYEILYTKHLPDGGISLAVAFILHYSLQRAHIQIRTATDQDLNFFWPQELYSNMRKANKSLYFCIWMMLISTIIYMFFFVKMHLKHTVQNERLASINYLLFIYFSNFRKI